MCFNLVKTNSELKHSSYSLKAECYLCSLFVRNTIYYVLIYKLIPHHYTFKVHELKAVNSGEQHLYLTHALFPSMPVYILSKYLLSEWKYVAFPHSLEHHFLVFPFNNVQGTKVMSQEEVVFPPSQFTHQLDSPLSAPSSPRSSSMKHLL